MVAAHGATKHVNTVHCLSPSARQWVVEKRCHASNTPEHCLVHGMRPGLRTTPLSPDLHAPLGIHHTPWRATHRPLSGSATSEGTCRLWTKIEKASTSGSARSSMPQCFLRRHADVAADVDPRAVDTSGPHIVLRKCKVSGVLVEHTCMPTSTHLASGPQKGVCSAGLVAASNGLRLNHRCWL